MKYPQLIKFKLGPVLASLSMACATLAHAGKETGNGGTALVCFSDTAIPAAIREQKTGVLDSHLDSITSITTYDLYEALLPRGYESAQETPIFKIEPGEGVRAYIERLASRWQPIVPNVASILRSGLTVFNNKNTIL